MSPNELTSFNYYILMILGLICEILGALFVSMEAIGIQTFTSFYKFIYKLSNWSKQSIFRILLLFSPFFALIWAGILMENKLLLSLTTPIVIIIMLISMIFDHPDYFEKFILNKTSDKKIGPLGFLIMVCGFLFQLTSIIWQMGTLL